MATRKTSRKSRKDVATYRPRNEDRIVRQALEELERWPSTAEKALLTPQRKSAEATPRSVPIRSEREQHPLSFDAAEALAGRWENSAWLCRQIGDDGESVTLMAVFADYERNIRHAISRRVPRVYREKGRLRRWPADEFANTVLPRESRRLLREVIMRTLPAWVKEAYRRRAEEILYSAGPRSRRRLLSLLRSQGITSDAIAERYAKPIAELAASDWVELRGLANGIAAGELTAEEAFGSGRASPVATTRVAPRACTAAGLFA